MQFPKTRLRRSRRYSWLRNLVRETSLSTDDLILPLFVHDNVGISTPIDGLDIHHYSICELIKVVRKATSLGINAIALFPVLNKSLQTPDGKEAYNPDNIICRSIKELKSAVPNIGVIADVALDPYTNHGHDGVITNNEVDNDKTLEILCKQAIVLTASGCDIVAPSDMMDGRIKEIRAALDNCNFHNTYILSYSAKYCSTLYSPFRHIVGSCSLNDGIDKSTYQLDIGNIKEAITEIQMDISEGADGIMVKPGTLYLDVIQRVSKKFNVPVFAYQVSGEYAMIRASAQRGWINYQSAMYESLICLKRAGARAILTYDALNIAERLNSRI